MAQPTGLGGSSTWRILVGAGALRLALVLARAYNVLQWRAEVSTPANSMRSVREGLHWASMHLSPYSGSLCFVPPLVLIINKHTAAHELLFALPNVLLDMVGGLILRRVGIKALPAGGRRTPNHLMAMYLLNPLTVAACVAGTMSTLEVLAVMTVVWMGVCGTWLGSAVALGLATYLDLHWALLVVPATLLLMHGPDNSVVIPPPWLSMAAEHGLVMPCPGDAAGPAARLQPADRGAGTHVKVGGSGSKQQRQRGVVKQAAQQGSAEERNGRRPARATGAFLRCLYLMLLAAAAWFCLAVASDITVQDLPGASCGFVDVPSQLLTRYHARPPIRQHSQWDGSTSPASRWYGLGSAAVPASDAEGRAQAATALSSRAQCWANMVYRLHLDIADQTPNIGQVWYLFTELFPAYVPLFRFVVHSLSAIMVLPLAIRFPHRPLLLISVQCLTTCMFKPYSSVADHALYMAFLPLLQPQLAWMRTGMFLTVNFLLLAVLEPSMWHMWINIESANSNFYYSISLLLGAWQTVLLVQLVLLTVSVEKKHRGVM